jgi:hypothetical protein
MRRTASVLSILFAICAIALLASGSPLENRLLAQVEAEQAQTDVQDPPDIQLPTDFSNEPPPEVSGAAIAGALACYGVFFLILLAVYLFVVYLLYTCYQRIPAQYRLMEPGQVWLMLIPLFHIVWQFFVVIRLSRSFQQYFAAKGRTDVGDCGESIGLWGMIFNLIGCAPVGFILWIIYLVKVTGLKNQIPEGATA